MKTAKFYQVTDEIKYFRFGIEFIPSPAEKLFISIYSPSDTEVVSVHSENFVFSIKYKNRKELDYAFYQKCEKLNLPAMDIFQK